MRQISTEKLELIGKGVTASVYALNDKEILKVFRNVVPQKEIKEEYACANLVNSLGISTPAAREMVQCGSETAIIYDRVHGVTLADEIKQHPDKYFEYGKRYGETVRKIHSKRVPDAPIPQAEPFMERLFQNTQDLITESEREQLISFLHLVPSADRLLHGDISPVNLMVEKNQLIVIDVPTIMKGHPIFDLLQPYAYCKMTPELYERYLSLSKEEQESSVGKFMARFGARYLGKGAAEQVWDGFFQGYFGDNPKISKTDMECVLRFYNAIKLIGSVYMRGKFDDDVVRYLVKEGRAEMKQLEDSFKNAVIAALNLEAYV